MERNINSPILYKRDASRCMKKVFNRKDSFCGVHLYVFDHFSIAIIYEYWWVKLLEFTTFILVGLVAIFAMGIFEFFDCIKTTKLNNVRIVDSEMTYKIQEYYLGFSKEEVTNEDRETSN